MKNTCNKIIFSYLQNYKKTYTQYSLLVKMLKLNKMSIARIVLISETKTSLHSKHDTVFLSKGGISRVKYRDDKMFLSVKHIVVGPGLRLIQGQVPFAVLWRRVGRHSYWQSVLERVKKSDVDVRSGWVIGQHSWPVFGQPHELWVEASRTFGRSIRVRRCL